MNIINIFRYTITSIAAASILFASCKKSLEVEFDKSRVPKDVVFNNDATATSALTGIYAEMLLPQAYASGSDRSVMSLAGLSADDFYNYPQSAVFQQFEATNLVPANAHILTLWSSLYRSIYLSNTIIEGLATTTGVSTNVKTQLLGEAYFIRAFGHFYAANLFGDAPLILTTDYRLNSVASRQTVSSIYQQVVADLQIAKTNLGDNYFTADRVRPNKATATALLARVYLYLGEWANAETQASSIISNSNYTLPANLDTIFKSNSKEAIWQLRPAIVGTNGYTLEAAFSNAGAVASSHALTLSLVNSFEAGDQRKVKWVGSTTISGNPVYFSAKYKQFNLVSPLVEYSMVFRLAEQYLIRAEARAQLGNLTGSNSAASDINAIRTRAGLINTTATTQPQIIAAIEKERRSEFFAEWGHRWLDLKRWNKATAVLSPGKILWTAEDVLYPLPQLEMDKNPNLRPQNPGY